MLYSTSIATSELVTPMLRIFLLATAVLSLSVANAGQVYKWVDKDGRTHYTNTPPPEAAQQERQVLDEAGRVTETLRAPRTEEEIAAERARKEEAARVAKEAEELAARDRMLLQTYTSIEEMQMARDGRIAALEAQVRVVSGSISSLESQLAEAEQEAALFRKAGKPVPEPLERKIANNRKDLLENQKFLMSRLEEQDNIRKKFDAEIERFKELKGIK